MAEAIFRLRLKDAMTRGLAKAGTLANRLRSSLGGVSSGASKVNDGFSKLNNTLRSGAGLMGGYFAISSIKAATSEALNAKAEFESMDNAIRFASSSALEGDKNLAFLKQTAKDLGLDIMAAQKGFKTFSGAMIGTSLQGRKSRDIFKSVSQAAVVMGLNAADQEGVFLALGQMMSKGKVSAEELQHQLGERLPGTLEVAARAMDTNKASLLKMMETGKLMSEDFLPKFAKELDKTFASGVPKASNSLRANMIRFSNMLLDFRAGIGDALTPVGMQFFGNVEKGLSVLQAPMMGIIKELGYVAQVIMNDMKPAVKWMIGGLTSTAKFMQENRGLMLSLGKGIMVTVGTLTAFATVMGIVNAVLWANPIGLVIGLVAGLAYGIYTAWNESETFRNTLKGIWGVMQELMKPMEAFSKLIVGIFTVNPLMIKSGLEEVYDSVKKMDLEGAFNKPFEESAIAKLSEGVSKLKDERLGLLSGNKNTGGINATPDLASGNPLAVPAGLSPKQAVKAETEVSGGGSGRMVNLRIDKIEVNAKVQDAMGMSLREIAEKVTKVIVGAASDAEVIMANG